MCKFVRKSWKIAGRVLYRLLCWNWTRGSDKVRIFWSLFDFSLFHFVRKNVVTLGIWMLWNLRNTKKFLVLHWSWEERRIIFFYSYRRAIVNQLDVLSIYLISNWEEVRIESSRSIRVSWLLLVLITLRFLWDIFRDHRMNWFIKQTIARNGIDNIMLFYFQVVLKIPLERRMQF